MTGPMRLAVLALTLALGAQAFAADSRKGAAKTAPLRLASQAVVLPDDAAFFPDGPGADLVNANCLACHSASMVLTQPVLTPAQWTATVNKMRDVYGAPVAKEDTAAIVGYLAALQAP